SLKVINGPATGLAWDNFADAIEAAVGEDAGLASAAEVASCSSKNMPRAPGLVAEGRTVTPTKHRTTGPQIGLKSMPAFLFIKAYQTPPAMKPIRLVTLQFADAKTGSTSDFARIEANKAGDGVVLGSDALAFYRLTVGDPKDNLFSLVVASPGTPMLGGVAYVALAPKKGTPASLTIAQNPWSELPPPEQATTLFQQDASSGEIRAYDATTKKASPGTLFIDGTLPVGTPVLSPYLSGAPSTYLKSPQDAVWTKVIMKDVSS
ncbi:MAG: hypothetical protein R3201_00090, partial [Oceanisphaera sp.]|nr:hypothetical protein [Oceanisphaera sp.]